MAAEVGGEEEGKMVFSGFGEFKFGAKLEGF
jgi:hypothetical protein